MTEPENLELDQNEVGDKQLKFQRWSNPVIREESSNEKTKQFSLDNIENFTLKGVVQWSQIPIFQPLYH